MTSREDQSDPLGLAAENLLLRAALAEARESIEGWAEYASEYFKDRWDLEGDLARVDAVLASPSPAAQAVREVVAQVLVRRAMKVRGIHGTGRNTGSIDEAAELLATQFPALAAGLEEEL